MKNVLRRALPPLVAVLGLHCSLNGLDEFSSQWGADAGDAGVASDSSAPPTDGSSPDAPGADGSSPDAPGTDSGCACSPYQECVAGKCVNCVTSWSVDTKSVSQTYVRNVGSHVDRPRRLAFMGAARASDERATVVEIGTCLGSLKKSWAGPMVGGRPIPGLFEAVGRADEVLFQVQGPTSGKLGSIVRFDLAKDDFSSVLDVEPFAAEASSNQPWYLATAPSGKIWMGGDYPTSGSTTRTPLLALSDGATSCSKGLTKYAGWYGRPIAINGDDVYYVLMNGPNLKVLRYSDAACKVAGCACEPAEELPQLAGPQNLAPFTAKVVASTLVIGGYLDNVVDPANPRAMLAQYIPATKSWNSLWTEDTSTAIDAVLALETDGSFVYAAMVKTFSFSGGSTSSTELLSFGLPIGSASVPKRIPVKKLAAAFSIDLDGIGGFIASGRSADTTADARIVRCPLTGCP